MSLNRMIQESANLSQKGKSQLQVGERIFRVGDRVIHRRNNYDLGVFNGDIGVIKEIDNEELTCVGTCFFQMGGRLTINVRTSLELDLAYSITIHKSQGSEFGAVIIPVLTQYFKMLFRNLIYTGLTRAEKPRCLCGYTEGSGDGDKKTRTPSQRQTFLQKLLA